MRIFGCLLLALSVFGFSFWNGPTAKASDVRQEKSISKSKTPFLLAQYQTMENGYDPQAIMNKWQGGIINESGQVQPGASATTSSGRGAGYGETRYYDRGTPPAPAASAPSQPMPSYGQPMQYSQPMLYPQSAPYPQPMPYPQQQGSFYEPYPQPGYYPQSGNSPAPQYPAYPPYQPPAQQGCFCA